MLVSLDAVLDEIDVKGHFSSEGMYKEIQNDSIFQLATCAPFTIMFHCDFIDPLPVSEKLYIIFRVSIFRNVMSKEIS